MYLRKNTKKKEKKKNGNVAKIFDLSFGLPNVNCMCVCFCAVESLLQNAC